MTRWRILLWSCTYVCLLECETQKRTPFFWSRVRVATRDQKVHGAEVWWNITDSYRLVPTGIRRRVPRVCCRVLLTSVVASHFCLSGERMFVAHWDVSCTRYRDCQFQFAYALFCYMYECRSLTLGLISQFHFIHWNVQRDEQAELPIADGQCLDLASHCPLDCGLLS